MVSMRNYIARFTAPTCVPVLMTATAPRISTAAQNSAQPGCSCNMSAPAATPTNGVISEDSDDTLTDTKQNQSIPCPVAKHEDL